MIQHSNNPQVLLSLSFPRLCNHIFDSLNKTHLLHGLGIEDLYQLANLAGISQSYLRDIELENKNPTVELISLICHPLDISLKDFFDVESTNSLNSDPLIQRIYQLNPQQRETLLIFLNTIK